MAVTVAWSDKFDANGVPLKVPTSISGVGFDHVTMTIPTTQLDDATDFTGLLAVPIRRKIAVLIIDSADFDGAANLDMDVVLRVWDNDAVASDTVLLNAGSLFQAAVTGKIVILYAPTEVPQSKDGWGAIGLKIVTAAGTPAAGAFSLVAFYV